VQLLFLKSSVAQILKIKQARNNNRLIFPSYLRFFSLYYIMLRQLIAVAVAAVIIIVALLMSSSAKIPVAAAAKPAVAPTLRVISTTIVTNQSIRTQIPLYGRLIAIEKIDVFSEVSGSLLPNSPNLRAGSRIEKGSAILRIDANEQRLALQAQRSALLTSITQILPDIKIDFADNIEAWEAYRRNFDVSAPLAALPTPKSDREKDFVALKTIYNQYYTIKSGEERISKYTLLAPFSGEVTESLISTGSYIRAGQKLATLMNTSTYELEAAVPMADLKYIKTGDAVKLSSEGSDNTWTGRIARIANTIDTKTQTLKLYIQVSGSGLRENMFLSGAIDATTVADVVELPRRLLIDNDKVYAYQPQDSSLRLIPAQIMRTNQETVFLRGIPNGTKLLNELGTGLYEGIKVQEAKTEKVQ
jgi:membrane fusion protein, multidrug efflux system